jgi:hypothetical protein
VIVLQVPCGSSSLTLPPTWSAVAGCRSRTALSIGPAHQAHFGRMLLWTRQVAYALPLAARIEWAARWVKEALLSERAPACPRHVRPHDARRTATGRSGLVRIRRLRRCAQLHEGRVLGAAFRDLRALATAFFSRHIARRERDYQGGPPLLPPGELGNIGSQPPPSALKSCTRLSDTLVVLVTYCCCACSRVRSASSTVRKSPTPSL